MFRAVEHYGRLAGYSEQRDIEKAWKLFIAEALDWSTLMHRPEYGMSDFPPPRYPFRWHELKARLEATYATPFSVSYVWHGLASPKRGGNVVAFHSRITELARLVGESPGCAFSARACGKYTTRKCRPQSSTP